MKRIVYCQVSPAYLSIIYIYVHAHNIYKSILNGKELWMRDYHSNSLNYDSKNSLIIILVLGMYDEQRS